MDIKEIKKDIVEYDLYEVLDDIPYGDYQLSILNEGKKITILVEDVEGSAAWAMNKDEFLNIATTKELEKYINNILYYNYVEYEGE
jgi:acetoacetate decarboxylase